MIQPDDRNPRARPVRDGQGAPVTCATCGCRLDGATDGTYLHFGRFAGRDARGCRVDCIEATHDELGYPVVALTA